jgi:hypothetical protein
MFQPVESLAAVAGTFLVIHIQQDNINIIVTKQYVNLFWRFSCNYLIEMLFQK